MKSYKRSFESDVLERAAHADIFELGTSPSFLFVLFGGSGIDDEEYERRSRSVIPVFDALLPQLTDVSAIMVHVTAPYDVPYARFSEFPSATELWKSHVLGEILSPWSDLPYFVCSFSGGAALALNGLQKEIRCFGGAALGADAIPKNFVCPDHWAEKLQIYSAPNDRVSHHPANRQLIEMLEDRGEVEEHHLRSGSHRLLDYATQECLGELIRFAERIVPSESGTQ